MTYATAIINEDSLKHARRLVDLLEKGDAEEAERALDALSVVRENSLFTELGKLTRELHDTLTGFQLDSKISAMAEKDIPDAKERLNHVIIMTEQAADRTLNAVEDSLPLSEQITGRTQQLHDAWTRFRAREMSLEEFREMSRELDEFLGWLVDKSPRLQGNLSDILMAQDFQDLTGQIIRRVIQLVQDVEESLVELVRITGERIKHTVPDERSAEDQEMKGPDIEACGPAVPGVDEGNVVSGQDDVDDLLSSLGF